MPEIELDRLEEARARVRARSVTVTSEERRPFFTPKALAAYLNVSDRTVRQMIADRRIESVRVEGMARIAPEVVDALCEQRGIEPPSHPSAAAPKPRAPVTRTAGPYDSWEPAERAYAAILTRDPCCYCGDPVEHIDHIVARSRAGEHRWENLTGACRLCNERKNAWSLLTFLLRIAP